jgi:hypothetical protein
METCRRCCGRFEQADRALATALDRASAAAIGPHAQRISVDRLLRSHQGRFEEAGGRRLQCALAIDLELDEHAAAAMDTASLGSALRRLGGWTKR